MAVRLLTQLSATFVVAVLAGCGTPRPDVPLDVVNVHASSAAYPWLGDFYSCASNTLAVRLSDPASAAISLRLGEPPNLQSPAYQIGVADTVVILHPQNGMSALSEEQVQSLFAGQVVNWADLGGADLPVEVWTYSSAEDIQQYFDRTVMNGRPVTSLAHLAATAQALSDAVGSRPGSIGVLPMRWQTGNTKVALVLPSIPVLAIVRTEPQGGLRDLLSCVQQKAPGS